MIIKPESIPTIHDVIAKYLGAVKLARSEHTVLAYHHGLNLFCKVLAEEWLNPKNTSIEKLTEDVVVPFTVYLKNYAPATEQLYLQAVKGFYEYVDAEGLAKISLFRLRNLIRQRARRPHIRVPRLPVNGIELILEFLSDTKNLLLENETNEKLRYIRDRAFLITLADTGLRVHEICKLKCGDVDWNKGLAVLIDRNRHQTIVRFSIRSLQAVKDYLSLRAPLDGASGRLLPSLPLFARHDKGAGKKIKPITTTTGRNIVAERVKQILGEEAVGKITPHSFRHHFVTTVLRGSGNLKLAQELARHANMQVTQRYAQLSDDELDKGYYEIFERPNE